MIILSIIRVTMNGTERKVSDDSTILDYTRGTNEEVPNVCYHPSLGAIETCDTCMVKVNGEIVRACSTEFKEDDVIETLTPDVDQAQKIAMDRILHNHELYCTVCDYNNGGCEIHNTVEAMRVEHQSVPFETKPYEKDYTNPHYRYDPDQCILCGRCVEACQDVQVTETLSIDWERERPRVIWDNDVPIGESSCVSCGHCSTVCPCNALIETNMEGEAGYMTGLKEDTLRPMIDITKDVETGYSSILALSNMESKMRDDRIEKTKTVCTYCGVGCSFDVWTKDREILKIEPQAEAPANGISTCVKGKFGWDFVNSEERLQNPLVRENGQFVETTWEHALNVIQKNFTSIKEESGNDALAFISSSKTSNEESYLMQKLSRSVMGTNNIDNCSRYCQTPATQGLFRTVGYGGDTGTIEDIKNAELIITVGTNTSESHPVLATRIKSSHKLRNQKLIVSDIRKHEMAERSDMFIQPKPGTDLVWLNAVAKYIIDQGWQDEEFINERVDYYDDFVKELEMYTIDYAVEQTGLSREELIGIAESIHEADTTCALWAMGVTQHSGGADTSTAISNLLLVSGNYGRNGTGAYPLRGHNNVQGATDFGSAPNLLPGYQSVEDEEVRHKFEQGWNTKLSSEVGMTNHEMVDAMHEGRLRSLYLKGEEMALVDSNINYVQQGFEKLDFFVVQDIFLSETAKFADVVLPASPSLEKDGTFVNTERRIQRLYKALDPLGNSKPDWEILQLVANRMGADWNYSHPSEIMAEAASLCPFFEGVSYERLEGYDSLVWPVTKEGQDEPLLYESRFQFPNGKARFYPVHWTEPQTFGEQYDLHVNNGRMLEHFHEGNMTYKTEGITLKTPDNFVEISPELAEERGLESGALVRLKSPYGAVRIQALVTDRVKEKQLYIPMNNSGESAINRLTSSEADKDTDTPAYKEAQVFMEVLSTDGEAPMPKNNFRYGNPQPQNGVEVERKWKRNDYIFPGDMVRKENR
ncbi:formate dehydrogenase subunit alpha [Marinococcus halophilus]|uniref:formate dehydrogenase subunit alpha n=1 Tax=Marinococcus halophilus TaxID=1371 RepID=UPI000BA005BB|nr:formate dehydrogenase subunit alpha [Marinococcus halophilus]OZT81272.1 formate dehydrogenase subunit alpha [Marinococcus halophilus]